MRSASKCPQHCSPVPTRLSSEGAVLSFPLLISLQLLSARGPVGNRRPLSRDLNVVERVSIADRLTPWVVTPPPASPRTDVTIAIILSVPLRRSSHWGTLRMIAMVTSVLGLAGGKLTTHGVRRSAMLTRSTTLRSRDSGQRLPTGPQRWA